MAWGPGTTNFACLTEAIWACTRKDCTAIDSHLDDFNLTGNAQNVASATDMALVFIRPNSGEMQTKERLDPLPKTPEPEKTMNVLSSSTNKANAVRSSATSKSHLVTTPDLTSRTLLPSNLAPSGGASFAPTFSGSTKGYNKTPPPSTVARRDRRRAKREERLRIALKLGRARLDLVSKKFTEKFLASTQEEQS